MKTHGLFQKTMIAALSCAGIFALLPAAQAEYGNGWQSADYLQARLISTSTAMGDSDIVNGAIEIRLEDGWHAYWRMPGEGGLPPRFSWDDSQNISSVDLKWPLPNRYKTLDMYSFGYKDHVLLPFTAVAGQAGEKMDLNLKADIMVCNDICVPQHVEMALNIPAGEQKPTMDSARIQTVVDKLPYKENRPNLSINNVVIGPKALVVTAFSKRGYDGADLFVEGGDLYMSAMPVFEKDEADPRKAIIRVAAPQDIDNLFGEIGHDVITLTFTDGVDAIERRFDFSE